jgi:hypothetical protein
MNEEQDELNELNEILEKYQPVRPLTVKDIRSMVALLKGSKCVARMTVTLPPKATKRFRYVDRIKSII